MKTREYVTKVIDGDTFKTASDTRLVRLSRVDAPEVGKRGAKRPTRALEKLILNRYVIIDTVATDPYRRRVAKVKTEDGSVNAAMRKVLKK